MLPWPFVKSLSMMWRSAVRGLTLTQCLRNSIKAVRISMLSKPTESITHYKTTSSPSNRININFNNTKIRKIRYWGAEELTFLNSKTFHLRFVKEHIEKVDDLGFDERPSEIISNGVLICHNMGVSQRGRFY